MFICAFFFLMCSLRRLSKCGPKYFTSFECEIAFPHKVNWGQLSFLNVKVMWRRSAHQPQSGDHWWRLNTNAAPIQSPGRHQTKYFRCAKGPRRTVQKMISQRYTTSWGRTNMEAIHSSVYIEDQDAKLCQRAFAHPKIRPSNIPTFKTSFLQIRLFDDTSAAYHAPLETQTGAWGSHPRYN